MTTASPWYWTTSSLIGTPSLPLYDTRFSRLSTSSPAAKCLNASSTLLTANSLASFWVNSDHPNLVIVAYRPLGNLRFSLCSSQKSGIIIIILPINSASKIYTVFGLGFLLLSYLFIDKAYTLSVCIFMAAILFILAYKPQQWFFVFLLVLNHYILNMGFL